MLYVLKYLALITKLAVEAKGLEGLAHLIYHFIQFVWLNFSDQSPDHNPADQQYYEYYDNITLTNEIKYSIRILLIYYNVLLLKYSH